MAQPEPLKILTIGSPLSELAVLSQKLTTFNSKHGPFDACLIAGDLFKEGSDGSELEGLSLSIPTYFTVGKNAFPAIVEEKLASGPELAPNLVFLGKSSVLSTPQGLKIAVVGGAWNEEVYESGDKQSAFAPVITQSDIKTLLSNPLLASPNKSGTSASLEAAKSAALAAELPSAFHGIDVLLTTSPPPSLSLLSPGFLNFATPLASPAPPLADVVRAARPRYIFWADGAGFWEREPFGWAAESGKEERWTRALKLGALGGPKDGTGKPPRWFYATTLPPQAVGAKLPTRPPNTTPNPFTMPTGSSDKKHNGEHTNEEDAKRAKNKGPPPADYLCKICNVPGHWVKNCPTKAQQDNSVPPPGYKCNICQSPDHYIRDCPNRQERPSRSGKDRPIPSGYVCRACGANEEHMIRDCPQVKEREAQRAQRKELGPEECWFCLSNPKVTKHLIVAIGQETYVTLPKGQLIPTRGGESPLVPGGGHVLIIPIAHHPTLLSIPAADAMNIITELESYKSSLRKCYAKYGAVPVTFEVGKLSGRGGHAHVQVVPVPLNLAEKVEDAFRKAGAHTGVDWEDEPERALARVGSSGNYFKVDLPDGSKLVHLIKGNFNLQFGRMVLSGLLGLHERMDWKACAGSDAEEKQDAAKFKKALAPFLP